MSDFHRSLDRALEHDPDEPVGYDGFGAPIYQWQDVGWIDQTDTGYDLMAIQAKINRDITALAAITLAPALFEERGRYDIRYRDPSIVEPALGAEYLFGGTAWRDPEPVFKRLEFTASIETIELLCGASLIPLCERKIPAEGTE